MALDFEMPFFTVAHKWCGYLQQAKVNFKEKWFWCQQQNETDYP